MQQILTPGMEHGEEADFRAQMRGIGGDRAQGLRGRAEQDVVDLPLVLIGEDSDLLRYGEDHVEVLRVQQLGLAAFQPLGARQGLALRAMAVAA